MTPTAHDWIAAFGYLETSGVPMLYGDMPTLELIQQQFDSAPAQAWRTPSITPHAQSQTAGYAPSQQAAYPTVAAAPAKRPRLPQPVAPAHKPDETPIVTPPQPLNLPAGKAAALEHIAQHCQACQRCDLCRTRTQAVPGIGHPDAPVVFVGEAPGAEEDRIGQPFVGPAGQLLDRMMATIGLQREHVYIANVVKCRPPGNRNPQTHEVALCQGYLHQQLEVISPKVIFALGRFAIQSLLGSTDSVAAIRRHEHSWRGIPVLASYHPAFYLRTPTRKKDGWLDLIRLQQLLENNPKQPLIR
ncbi:phage SPO1 DNA polymerase-related protein [Magnetococcus marinus MC-1]|uniref:Type-4 uracil-DNA glycosylase n=1 Tax=Magnetococcus marinus (strain ATCC BAA-1437 / JCM 17883 / MC-1) TaxID=156889 RepID=A0LD48_MAGMM|nr:uracil-DNA glycosylase [Magnetococcus marinus]ABK45891.1 phage SPO1 DNA polymerase-related protein [Magnetococcus marinus MC-1]